MADWIAAALAFAEMSQVTLAERMTQELGRSIGKAAVNKMMYPEGREHKQAVKADELYAISKITGFPVPPVAAKGTYGVYGDWRAATPPSEQLLIFNEEQGARLRKSLAYLLERLGRGPEEAAEATEVILRTARGHEFFLEGVLSHPPKQTEAQRGKPLKKPT